MSENIKPNQADQNWQAPVTGEPRRPGVEAAATTLWQPSMARDANGQTTETGVTDPNGQFHRFTQGESFALIRTDTGDRKPFVLVDGQKMPFDQWLSGSVMASREHAETRSTIAPASEKVFNGVYEQLKNASSLKTPEQLGKEFVENIIESTGRRIESVESSSLATMLEEIHQDTLKFAEWYRGSDQYDQQRQVGEDLQRRFSSHVERLIQAGEIDELTAKVFIRNLKVLKYIGNYNAVVRNHEPITPEELRSKNTEFMKIVAQIWDEYPTSSKSEQETGGFVHFNSQLEGKTTGRLYISAQLGKNPAQVVQAWNEALKATGMREKVYFKIPDGLSTRHETVIVYYGEGKPPSDQLERLLQEFRARYPEDLLSAEDMPSGVPLSKGLCIAPEVSNVNRFLMHINPEKPGELREELTVSYNQLMVALSDLSFNLAYRNAEKANKAVTGPKSLKEDAQGYFNQLLKLSGINPNTMMLTALGGQLPDWAERLKGV